MSNLSEYEIQLFWGNLRKDHSEFHLLVRNCSSVVASAIQIGCKPNLLEEIINVFKKKATLGINISTLGGMAFSASFSAIVNLYRITGLASPPAIGTIIAKDGEEKVVSLEDIYEKFMRKRPNVVWTPMQVKMFAEIVRDLKQ